MSSFSRRQYEIVAKALLSSKPEYDILKAEWRGRNAIAQWERTCLAFINHFRQDNPQFDTTRFMAACKGEKVSGGRTRQ